MKITKTFVSVFLVTFLIGHASVLPTKKTTEPIQVSETTSKKTPVQQLEKTPELETLEEVSNYIGRKKYPFEIKLLETGEGFHAAEVDAKSDEIWLGLFQEDDKFYLRSTKLKIERVFDPIADENEGEKTGKSVDVKSKIKPLFLLKNAEVFEGKVLTLFRGVTWEEYFNDSKKSKLDSDDVLTILKKGFVQKYEFGGEKYEFKVIEAKNKERYKILALILENNETRQILHTQYDGDKHNLGTLFWVGDLDRDGKPDFYLELFEGENVDNKVLFLTSSAEKDELVKKVAYFWTTGC